MAVFVFDIRTKCSKAARLPLLPMIDLCLCFFGEIVFVYAAEGTFEIRGEILEFRSGSDTVLGSAERFVIYPAANVTYIFFHFFAIPFFHEMGSKSAAPCLQRGQMKSSGSGSPS